MRKRVSADLSRRRVLQDCARPGQPRALQILLEGVVQREVVIGGLEDEIGHDVVEGVACGAVARAPAQLRIDARCRRGGANRDEELGEQPRRNWLPAAARTACAPGPSSCTGVISASPHSAIIAAPSKILISGPVTMMRPSGKITSRWPVADLVDRGRTSAVWSRDQPRVGQSEQEGPQPPGCLRPSCRGRRSAPPRAAKG